MSTLPPDVEDHYFEYVHPEGPMDDRARWLFEVDDEMVAVKQIEVYSSGTVRSSPSGPRSSTQPGTAFVMSEAFRCDTRRQSAT